MIQGNSKCKWKNCSICFPTWISHPDGFELHLICILHIDSTRVNAYNHSLQYNWPIITLEFAYIQDSNPKHTYCEYKDRMEKVLQKLLSRGRKTTNKEPAYLIAINSWDLLQTAISSFYLIKEK